MIPAERRKKWGKMSTFYDKDYVMFIDNGYVVVRRFLGWV